MTHEFLRQLAKYINGDEELTIQTAGYTRCRFQMLAKRYVVRDGEGLHADLSGIDPIDEELLFSPWEVDLPSYGRAL